MNGDYQFNVVFKFQVSDDMIEKYIKDIEHKGGKLLKKNESSKTITVSLNELHTDVLTHNPDVECVEIN